MVKLVRIATLITLLGSFLITSTACRYGPINEAYTLQVVGPPGTRFTLQCNAQVEQWLSQDIRTVELNKQDTIGVTGAPQEYHLSGREIYCNVQNLQPNRSLNLTLQANNTVVDTAHEQEPTGDVAVGYASTGRQ